jgi:hypothetical protein
MEIGADDVGVRIDRLVEHDHLVAGAKILARYKARRSDFDRLARCQLDGVEAIATVEQLLRRFWVGAPQHDGAGQPVLDDVFADRAQLVRRHAREQLGGRMHRQDIAPGATSRAAVSPLNFWRVDFRTCVAAIVYRRQILEGLSGIASPRPFRMMVHWRILMRLRPRCGASDLDLALGRLQLG